MCKTLLNTGVFLLLSLPIITQAQSESVPERLQMLLRESKPDTNQVKLLLELGSYYLYKPHEFKVDLDSAMVFFQAAKKRSESLHSKKWTTESLWMISLCYFEARQVQQGENAFLEIVKDCQKLGDKAQEAEAWLTIGKLANRNDSTYEEIILYFEKAIALYQQLNDKEKEIYALKEIADVHLNQGKLEESEEELLNVIEQYKSIGFRNLHYTYDLLAAVSTLRGNLNRALFYGLEMMKSMEATGDSTSALTFYYRIGRIYGDLEQTEKSIYWIKKAYTKSTKAHYGLCAMIVNGLTKLEKAKEALAFVQNVIKQSPPLSIAEKAYAAEALGNCYNALQQYDLAEKHYLEMIRYEALLQNRDHYTASVNFTIGKFYVNQHRYSAAAPYLNKVLAVPDGIVTTQRLKDAYLLLFKVDSAAGNYLKAIQHFQVHKTLNDSLFNETKSRQIEELQIQYETDQKEKDIKLLQNESALQKSQLQQANLTKNITFGGITLLLIIVSLLYNRYRLKQRSNRKLEIQQIEINQTNRSLQNLLEEKEWLLREIHHRVKNNLQIVMSLLNTQSVYLENDAALSAIRDSQHRIHSISLIHQKLYQSRNVALIEMSAYIQELVQYLQDSFDAEYDIRFDLQVDSLELDVTQAVPVGLILNEAISNAIKYAFPSNHNGLITISMQETYEDHFLLTIADNGVGLPHDFDLNKSNTLGMSLMKGLSKQLNGSFDLHNVNGLTIHIAFADELISKSLVKSNEMQLTA